MRGIMAMGIAVGVLCGCAESEYARRLRMATEVATGPSQPSSDCQAFEQFKVEFFGGAHILTPQRASEEVVTSMRYEAAKQGANYVQLQPITLKQRITPEATWIHAEVEGTPYRCPEPGGAASK